MRALAAFVLLLVPACASHPKHAPGDEYVKKIKINGNKALSSKTLVAGIALDRAKKHGRAPDPYLVETDRDRIRGEYLRRGFLDVDVRPRVERDGDAATIVYDVEEGVRAATRVVIRGLPPDVPMERVRKKLPLKDGGPFSYEKYELAKEPLIGVVEDAGYAHAKLDATIYADRAAHEAVVALDYSPGPKSTFGTVTINGVSGELADAVRNRLQFVEGQQYSTGLVTQSQRNLYALGRFSTVQITHPENTDPNIPITVSVTQSPRHTVELGGGFGIDPVAYEVRGRAGYSIVGWPFPLDTVTLEARPAYAILRDGDTYEPRMRALARLERQDLFWTYAKGDVEGGYNYLSQLAYTSYGPRARLGFSSPLLDKRRTLNVQVGWGIERLEFRNISEAIDPTLQMELGLDRPERIGAYSQAITLDLRDHPIEPKLGMYAEVRAAEGTKYAGGAFEYLQLVPEVRGYVPVGPVVLASRLRVGAIRGEVPVTERFFAGGASSQRGFGERMLAPFVVDADGKDIPYGGAALLETGLEARMHVTTWRKMPISTVVFLDGGDVAEGARDIDPMNLHWAVGTGLRLHTIVGPIRADLGRRITRTGPLEPEPGSKLAFHLSVGEAF